MYKKRSTPNCRRKKLWVIRKLDLVFLLLLFSPLLHDPLLGEVRLQNLIDRTPAGETLELKPRLYLGPVIIDKPLILDGQSQATVDGQGNGSVILITADGVTVKNLSIINSGDSHDRVDAGILVRSSHNTIANNHISNALFGIDFKEAHQNMIVGNDISSKPADLGIRGDGVRVWASHGNTFRKNKIHDSRDMVIWYSNDNLIEDNEGWNNRYSLHFMYAGGNQVRRNKYHHNTVGIFLMYSLDSVVEHNDIRYSLGSTGVGIGLKEADNMTLRFNSIVYCTTGLYLDLSPFQPDTYNFIKANRIAYNVTGIGFNSDLSRNIIKGNAFIDNLESISVHANGTARNNFWEGNYYSDYQGFDRDRDGYGDNAYSHHVFFDSLWMDDDWMRFFYGSPVIAVVNFLARLAPLTEPRHLMTDQLPVFSSNSQMLVSENNLFFKPKRIDTESDDADDDDDNGDVPARFADMNNTDDDDEDDMPARFKFDEDTETSDSTKSGSKKNQSTGTGHNRYFLKQ